MKPKCKREYGTHCVEIMTNWDLRVNSEEENRRVK
jgi:hypothetical protein